MPAKRDSLHARRLELFRNHGLDYNQAAIQAASEYRQQHPPEQDEPNPNGYTWTRATGPMVGKARNAQ